MKKAGRKRVTFRRREEEPAFDLDSLIQFVTKQKGPRLLIVNTVQTAAVVAEAMRSRRLNALHLSTSLAPAHRNLVIDRIKWRLRDNRLTDWTLVATSCVEAGMDFSFRNGIRERSSTASLIQISGRVNRNGEYGFDDSFVRDVLLQQGPPFTRNRSLTIERNVLGHFSIDNLNEIPADELSLLAMKEELSEGGRIKAEEITNAETGMEYPTVSDLCQLIDNDNRLVVVDEILAASIRTKKPVNKIELQNYSVQIRPYLIEKLSLAPLDEDKQIYDEFESFGIYIADVNPGNIRF